MEIKENISKSFHIWIPLEYSYILETKTERTLVINDSLFLETILKTIKKWKAFLNENKDLYEEVKKIRIDESKNTNFMKPIVSIKLTEDYEIHHDYGVNLLLSDFIIASLKYLAKEPIKLSGWALDFTLEMREKIEKLKNEKGE